MLLLRKRKKFPDVPKWRRFAISEGKLIIALSTGDSKNMVEGTAQLFDGLFDSKKACTLFNLNKKTILSLGNIVEIYI